MKQAKTIEWDQNETKLSDLKPFEAELLRRAIEIAREAKERGDHPFGCLLADENGNILMEQGNEEVTGNGNCTAHAETELMRRASQVYSKDELARMTMYNVAEGCAMCTGAMYWGNLGRTVYICRESELKKVTGDDPRNPTLDLPSRAVVACGQKPMEIVGPIIELEPEFLALHRGYWDQRS